MSNRDRNTQWQFSTESTEPIPSEPFHVFSISLTAQYANKLRDAVAEDIAPHIKGIRNLEFLWVNSDKVTSLGMEKLLAIPEFQGISALQLDGALFDDQIFGFLAKLPNLTNVHFGTVPSMTGIGIGSLAACPELSTVAWTLASPKAESMEELSKLPHLVGLEINSVKCTESHVMAIAKLKLRNLLLYNSGLDDAMLKHLAKLTELESLNISHSQVSDAGLLELQVLEKLKVLDVRNTLVTEEGVAEFNKAVSECQVITDLSQPDT